MQNAFHKRNLDLDTISTQSELDLDFIDVHAVDRSGRDISIGHIERIVKLQFEYAIAEHIAAEVWCQAPTSINHVAGLRTKQIGMPCNSLAGSNSKFLRDIYFYAEFLWLGSWCLR
jgi:hypothetical protein